MPRMKPKRQINIFLPTAGYIVQNYPDYSESGSGTRRSYLYNRLIIIYGSVNELGMELHRLSVDIVIIA